MRYAIVIEKGEDYFSAYIPDLIGCTVTALTVDEIKVRIQEEAVSHLASMRADGLPVDAPTTTVAYIEVE